MYKQETVRLYPNSTMKLIFWMFCCYRLYCWNKALELWNFVYDLYRKGESNRPSEYSIRNRLVKEKQDWENIYPSRILRYAVKDLSDAWKHFLNKDTPDWGKPKFKSKKKTFRFGFKLEDIKIVNNKLYLTKSPKYKGDWYGIRFRGSKYIKNSDDIIGGVSFYIENGKYYASFTYKINNDKIKSLTNIENAIDLNVGRFTDINGDFNVITKQLNNLYKKVAFYNKILVNKRLKNKNYSNSKSYDKMRIKLRRSYRKAVNVQHDLVKKYINNQLHTYSSITIEDLNVKGMKMGVASKGLHRSLFGFFKEWIKQKSEEYDCELVIADRGYPSTQRCSCCGHIKTGIDKITLRGNEYHNTKYNEYICYECGFKDDRDDNSVKNLLSYKYLNWS